MIKSWTEDAWEDYLYWQNQDKKTLKRINALLRDIERGSVSDGMGKPEALKHIKAWSRRIDDKNRLVYTIADGQIIVISCRGHYDK